MIAFHSDRFQDFAIYLMNPDGTGAVRISDPGVPDELPAWSPDGTRIAFDSGGDLYVTYLDGRGTTLVLAASAGVAHFRAGWRPVVAP
jgi:Tol biopolymer transport system component